MRLRSLRRREMMTSKVPRKSRRRFFVIGFCALWSTVALAQFLIWRQPMLPFPFVFPSSPFFMPQYPLAPSQTTFDFPFYAGETTVPLSTPTSSGSNATLYSKYVMPSGTHVQLKTPPPAKNYSLDDDSYYEVHVNSLKRNDVDYESLVKDQIYQVKGKDLNTSTRVSTAEYQLAKDTPLFQAQQIKIREAPPVHKLEACTECAAAKSAAAQILPSAKLGVAGAAINKVLQSGAIPQTAKQAVTKAWNYFKANSSRIENQKYMTVVDYNQPPNMPRMYLINLQTGAVEPHLVAQGANSSDASGMAVRYSNRNNETHQSSYGAFLTAETYDGHYGYSLKLDGQEKGVNDNARKRTIVVHGWEGITEKPNDPYASNVNSADDTWGCFGLSKDVSSRVIDDMKNGGLWYVEPKAGAVLD